MKLKNKALWVVGLLVACFFVSLNHQDGVSVTFGETAQARSRGAVYGRDQGIHFNLGLGVNGCTDRLCHDVDPMINLRLAAIFRFKQYYGVGLHMAFNFGHPRDEYANYLSAMSGEEEFDSFWMLVIAPEFRLFMPQNNWDLWVGVLPGYARWMSHGDFLHRDGFDASMEGFMFGWGVGGDYFIHPMIALGVAAYFYHPLFDEVCVEEGNDNDCWDMSQWDRHDIGFWWTVGFRFTFFLEL